LLGPSGSGKSSLLRVVAASSCGSIVGLQQSLYPASLAQAELYGAIERGRSREWQDGVITHTLRRHAAALKPSSVSKDCSDQTPPSPLHWVVFDGPLDAAWADGLSTVLDDSPMLCLASSERIRLSEGLRLFFECEDLCTAAPMTISRCGIVCTQPLDLDALQRLLDQSVETSTIPWITANAWSHVRSLVHSCVPEALKFLRAAVQESLPTTDLQLASSFSRPWSSSAAAHERGGALLRPLLQRAAIAAESSR